MQPIQWSEPFARLRRLARTVGQQALTLEEVASPTIVLADVGGPPFRSEPRRCAFSISQAPTAVANTLNGALFWSNTNPIFEDGAFVVKRVTLTTGGVAGDANQRIAFQLLAAILDGTLGGTSQMTPIEPIGVGGVNVGQIGPILTVLSSSANVVNSRVLMERQIVVTTVVGEFPTTVVFDDVNAIVLPPKLTAGGQGALLGRVLGVSAAGVNNVGLQISVEGDLFINYPPR